MRPDAPHRWRRGSHRERREQREGRPEVRKGRSDVAGWMPALRRAGLAVALLSASAIAASAAQAPANVLFAGRPLTDALHDLEAQGLKIVYSTELVRSDMRVIDEPRA